MVRKFLVDFKGEEEDELIHSPSLLYEELYMIPYADELSRENMEKNFQSYVDVIPFRIKYKLKESLVGEKERSYYLHNPRFALGFTATMLINTEMTDGRGYWWHIILPDTINKPRFALIGSNRFTHHASDFEYFEII